VAGSSGAEGGVSSVSSQGGANLGFSSQMSGLGQQFTALSGQAASLASKSQSQAAMGSLGFQAYSFGSSVKEAGGFKKAFTA
jgi:hypothetical protein